MKRCTAEVSVSVSNSCGKNIIYSTFVYFVLYVFVLLLFIHPHIPL